MDSPFRDGEIRSNESLDGQNLLLNSWKEIARYLGRGVRTVQRWEQNLGLPVHRPKGQDRSATLALRPELDEWLRKTPVRSRPNGHAGNGRIQNEAGERRPPVSAVRIGSPLSKNGSGRRPLILSVDDDPDLLYTRQKVLEGEGYEVLNASDGQKAIEVFAAHVVDLVLLDYRTAKLDGGTVAKEIKRRAPMTRVIMISKIRAPGEALENVDCFIPKGDGPELLLAAIRQLLGAKAGTLLGRSECRNR